MCTIKHPRWKVRKYIKPIKKRCTLKTKEQVEEHMSVNYDIFEVPRSSSTQQNRTSKRKRTPTGTMEINPKRQKYDVLRTSKRIVFGGEMLYSGSYHVTSGILEEQNTSCFLSTVSTERSWSVVRQISDVTSTAWDVLYLLDWITSVNKQLTLFHCVSLPYNDTTIRGRVASCKWQYKCKVYKQQPK